MYYSFQGRKFTSTRGDCYIDVDVDAHGLVTQVWECDDFGVRRPKGDVTKGWEGASVSEYWQPIALDTTLQLDEGI